MARQTLLYFERRRWVPSTGAFETFGSPEETSYDVTVFQTGAVVAGRYRLIRPIGAGGFGEVWEADQFATSATTRKQFVARRVALKLLKLDGGPEERARWIREVQAVSSAGATHVPTIYDFDEASDSLAFIAMQRLHGNTLAALIEDSPACWRRVLRIAADVAEALERCHAVEVIHADLKPSNIFMTKDDRVFVLDFGIASLRWGTAGGVAPRDDAEDDATVQPHPDAQIDAQDKAVEEARKAHDGPLGTRGYLAPEILLRLAPRATPASDVFSLGVTLFKLLTQRFPYRGNPNGGNVAFDSLRTVRPDLPQEVARLVDDMLSTNPGDRPVDTLRSRIAEAGRRPYGKRTDLWPGCRPFALSEAGTLQGRDAETEAITSLLKDRAAVLVTGAQGVGKTSLVRAGVAPALDEALSAGIDGWDAILVHPAAARLTSLDGADATAAPSLARRGHILIVDPLDVVLDDEADLQAFASGLKELCQGERPHAYRIGTVSARRQLPPPKDEASDTVVRPRDAVRVVFVADEDGLGALLRHEHFAWLRDIARYNVAGIDPQGMRSIIAHTAAAAEVEVALRKKDLDEIDALLSDPAKLPLVSLGLRQWAQDDPKGKLLAAREPIDAAWKRALAGAPSERLVKTLVDMFEARGTRISGRTRPANEMNTKALEVLWAAGLVSNVPGKSAVEPTQPAIVGGWAPLAAAMKKQKPRVWSVVNFKAKFQHWSKLRNPAQLADGGELALILKHIDPHLGTDGRDNDYRAFLSASNARKNRIRATIAGAALAGIIVVALVIAFAVQAITEDALAKVDEAAEAAKLAEEARDLATFHGMLAELQSAQARGEKDGAEKEKDVLEREKDQREKEYKENEEGFEAKKAEFSDRESEFTTEEARFKKKEREFDVREQGFKMREEEFRVVEEEFEDNRKRLVELEDAAKKRLKEVQRELEEAKVAKKFYEVGRW